ncbi:hypothetical protein GCM10027592_17230 [Spirosoma flavus]
MLIPTSKRSLLFLFFFVVSLVTATAGLGQSIRGTVFRDFNSNGVYEAITNPASYSYGEPGIGGITVTAYNANGVAVGSTVSSTLAANLGSYSLAVGNSNAYRVEFSGFSTGDYESFRGSGSATSVQFVNGGSTNVNFGLNYPADYCQSLSPQMITTCFIAGNAANGSSAITSQVALVGTPYTVEDDTKTMTYYASIGEIGSAWGVAYNKDSKQLFTAAFTKRHVGFSAGGPNAIYVTSPSSATSGHTTLFFNFSSVGGTAVTSTTEAHGNDLPTTSPGLASHDNAAFDAVGKTSLGGMDISDDGKTLYVVNLKNRNLYTIDVATKAATGVLIPNPGCVTSGTVVNGSYRPFAVKYYRGKIYIGVVCTREDLGTSVAAYGPTNGLSATVYAVDPAAPSTFSTVLSFPLTYQKAATNADKTPATTATQARAEFWRPWTSIYQVDRNEGVVSYPQAWFTDIEFESGTGDMLIGMRDRFGDQIGYKNYKPFTTDTDLISAISPGEILRARKCNATDTQWTIESNGALCGTVTSASATQSTVAGPGTGKYYWGDRVQDGGNHGLSSQAGIAQLSGSAKVAMTAVDPTEIFNTGGIKRLINATGAKDGNPTGTTTNPDAGIVLYTDNALGYGKANGLGDLELVCNPAPIQIGNRVWMDRNNNGVQDPTETPLAGVRVTLSGTGLTTPVSVTTNANGEYYFSNASGTSAVGFVYSLTGLTAGGSYSLSFPTSYSTLTLSTKPNAATGTNADNIDSDPNSTGLITFTLGQSGQNNFSFDAAYSSAALAITATAGTCDPATNSYAVTGTVSFTNVPDGTVTLTDGVVSTTLAVAASTTSVTYSLSGLVSGTGTHTVTASYSGTSTTPASATYAAPPSCSVGVGITATPGLCQTATNGYTLTGMISLTNAIAGTATIQDGTLSTTVSVGASATSVTYSLTGLVSGTGSHTVTVTYASKTASATYAAPTSCSVAPCSLTVSAIAGQCNPATNTFSNTVVVNVTNVSNGILTVTDGAQSLTFATTSASLGSYTATFNSLVANGSPHTVIASLPGCSTVSTTYTAPASCSVAPICSLSAAAMAGNCSTATNTYSATAVVQLTNPTAGTLTITNGGQSATFVTTSVSSATYTAVFNNLISDGSSHTVLASLPGCSTVSTTYSAPASCTVGVSVTATPGLCQSATNGYTLTGTISLNNAVAGVATIQDGALSTTVSVGASATSVTYLLTGLVSGTGSHTVIVTYASKTTSATYSAPASCTIGAAVTANPGVCKTATNNYAVMGTLSLTNAVAGVATIQDGAVSTTVLVGDGATSVAYSLSGLASGTGSHTVTVTYASTTASATYTAPLSCSVAPICSLSAIVRSGSCNSATNTYSATAVVTLQNSVAGILTIAQGAQSVNLTTTLATGVSSYTAVLTNLPADGASHNVMVNLPGCGGTTATYSAPASCTTATLELEKFVNKSKARVGELLSYTVVLTNTGNTAASNVVVKDSMSVGLRYVANSASAPASTTFSPGSPVSIWTIASIGAGQSLSLILQGIADSTGILHNTSSIPGDTAAVCTSIPARVCADEVFEYRLTAPLGRSHYQWYKDGQPIPGATTNVLSVTSTGAYTLAVNNQNGQCPDFSCCPFIIEEDSIPHYRAAALPATCVGNVTQPNGRIVLSDFQASYTYQYSLGSSFTSSLSGAPQPIPTNGVLVSNLANPISAQAYTVRVFNQAGCYTDVTVLLQPTVCGCPADICVPFVLKQTKRAKRIGDSIR